MIESKLYIDHNSCTRCGNCTQICGSKTLEIIENSLVQVNPTMCCSCGHCAAICNEDAISIDKDSRRAFSVKKYDENLSEIEKLLIGKRSVREYKNKDLEKSIIENMIHYAEKSPSSSNKRKREYLVVTDKTKIQELEKAVLQKFNSFRIILNPFVIGILKLVSKKLGHELSVLLTHIRQMNTYFEQGKSPIFRNAPAIVCITAPKGATQSVDDCIIAQQYMMLYAQSKGIASCIIGYAQYAHTVMEKKLNLKKGKVIYAVSIFGFPKFVYKKEIEYLRKPEVTWW